MNSLENTTKKEHSSIKTAATILLLLGIVVGGVKACSDVYNIVERETRNYLESHLYPSQFYGN
jgi:hypothetical protein